VLYFFFNDTATTEIYTLSLHDRSSDLTEVSEDAATDKVVVVDAQPKSNDVTEVSEDAAADEVVVDAQPIAMESVESDSEPNENPNSEKTEETKSENS